MTVREYVHPGRWKYRDLLVEFDRQHEKGGSWVAAIDDVFDHEWLLEQKDMLHAVAGAMFWPYALSTRNLADIGDLVCVLRHARGDADPIVKRLKVHEQFGGASFEVRVARLLVEAELPFEFVPAKGDGKAQDIRVGGPTPFLTEVKSREQSFRAWVEDSLVHAVFPYVSMSARGCLFEFDWSGPDVSNVRADDQALERLDELAARIVSEVRAALAVADPPSIQIVEVNGVGSVTIHHGATTPSESAANGAVNDEREAVRLAKTISKAARQLDPSWPGVVFLCVEADALEKSVVPDVVARFLGARGAEFPHVAGAVVLVLTSADAIVEETWPVPNPHSSVELASLGMVELRQNTRRERWKLDDPYALPAEFERPGR